MKTAVSIPDDVFEKAERLARRMKKSRSQLFGNALEEYVARHAPDHVTETMDRVCAEIGAEPRRPVRVCRVSPHSGAQRVVISQGDIWCADLPNPTGVWTGVSQTVTGFA